MAKGPLTRKSKARPAKRTWCVVVEGIETERRYFTDAKAEFDRLQHEAASAARAAGKVGLALRSLQVVVAGGLSFEHVLNTALAQLDVGHERIYCVVDADFYTRLTGAERANADKRYQQALDEGIDVILSNPCFEVWFRHHFNADTGAWTNGKAAKEAIERLWPEYRSKPDRHWELLKSRHYDAVGNAKIVRDHHGVTEARQIGVPVVLVEDRNASTNVDWLIRDLFCGG